MKKVIAAMEALNAALGEEIATREFLFDKRSSRWQCSHNGIVFSNLTDRLKEKKAKLVEEIVEQIEKQ